MEFFLGLLPKFPQDVSIRGLFGFFYRASPGVPPGYSGRVVDFLLGFLTEFLSRFLAETLQGFLPELLAEFVPKILPGFLQEISREYLQTFPRELFQWFSPGAASDILPSIALDVPA